MIINLYTLNKRENSTLRPTGSGQSFECYLKAPTSIIDPVIVIDFGDAANPQAHYFNYAYIPDFARYYFISDIRSVGKLWEFSLNTDILATYKDRISTSTLYLTRCSSQYDGDIVDTYYPVKVSHTVNMQSVVTPWIHTVGSENVDIQSGSYVIGITAQPGTKTGSMIGSIRYVALNHQNMINLLNYLLDSNNLTQFDIDGMSDEAVKSIIDPLSFIKSCQWTPIEYTAIGTTEQTDGLSIWTLTVDTVAYKPLYTNIPYYSWSVSFANIAKHPQASSRGNYLNTEPYTKLVMSVPPFGMIELDTNLAAPVSTIIGRIIFDLVTGTGILEIHYGQAISGAPAARLKSQIGVPIQLTQVYNDYINAGLNAASSIAGGIASLLTGNISGAISGGVSAIGSAVNAMKPIQSSLGGNGGFSDLYGQARLYSIFYDPAPEDLAHVGRPLCQNKLMSTIASGSYCMAMDGDIPISGTSGEQQQLKAYLEGGFYYE